MRNVFFSLLLILPITIFAQVRTIHVFVALCDNEFQGIVRVPESIGNGKKPSTNLYWGAGYGVKNFFDRKTDEWELIMRPTSNNPYILSRVLFKHKYSDTYLLADAYDGEQIQTCISDFIHASNYQKSESIPVNSEILQFSGGADLLAYVGHDGLMEFDIDINTQLVESPKDVIILGCYSKEYFQPYMVKTQSNPVLWTTHLMAPEAYTLKSAIDGWILHESGLEIEERAAQTYNQYQKCGIKGARNLFTTGY